MTKQVGFSRLELRKVGTELILGLLLALFISSPAVASIDMRYEERNPAGWFVLFHAENEDNFKGEVAHLHIYDGELDQARDFIEDSLDVTFSIEGQFGEKISASVGRIVSWLLGAAGNVASNSNGSFDIFLMTGAKEFFGVTTPVVFAGFVPDQIYKPPLPAEFISITGIPAANSLGDHFRDWPKPSY